LRRRIAVARAERELVHQQNTAVAAHQLQGRGHGDGQHDVVRGLPDFQLVAILHSLETHDFTVVQEQGTGCHVTAIHTHTVLITRVSSVCTQIGLNIQFYHHLICGLAVGIVFYDKSNDGSQFFNHMKFCMGNILFHTFTQSMVQVLACTYY